jgi:SAM-dependent methyltransferase
MNDSPQYRYVVELVQRHLPHPGAVVLDYGCGAGQIVEHALTCGIDAHGVDVFYGGGTLRAAATSTGLFGTRIREIVDGTIPWPDRSVDLVVSNMVFEHIRDFAPVLDEVARVMKPGAVFLNLFPSALVWREGHVGLPWIHRLRPGALRLAYARALRDLGFGYNKGHKPHDRWAAEAVSWVDAWTHYKPLDEIERLFARRFECSRIDADFVLGRLREHTGLAALGALASAPALAPAVAWAAARLATHVFVLRKPTENLPEGNVKTKKPARRE